MVFKFMGIYLDLSEKVFKFTTMLSEPFNGPTSFIHSFTPLLSSILCCLSRILHIWLGSSNKVVRGCTQGQCKSLRHQNGTTFEHSSLSSRVLLLRFWASCHQSPPILAPTWSPDVPLLLLPPPELQLVRMMVAFFFFFILLLLLSKFYLFIYLFTTHDSLW